MQINFKIVSAQEAANYVNDEDVVGFSGFTPAGAPKVVAGAIAAKAESFHAEGKPLKIS